MFCAIPLLLVASGSSDFDEKGIVDVIGLLLVIGAW